MNVPKYTNLVLSGGSIKGISHVGALSKLIENGLVDLKKINKIAATSAGVLLGVLIVLGFDIDEIWKFLLNLNFKKLVKPNLLLLLQKMGVESGETFYNFFETILELRTGIKHITFKQLYDIYKIHFIVVATNLTEKKEVYFDYINYPDFQVALSIRASISIPGLFAPVVFDGKTYIDGGLLNNFPMNLFSDEMEKTVGLLICTDYNTEYIHPEQYVMSIINLLTYKYFKDLETRYPNTVRIKNKYQQLSIFNFDINTETKIKLYNSGIESAKEFINNL